MQRSLSPEFLLRKTIIADKNIERTRSTNTNYIGVKTIDKNHLFGKVTPQKTPSSQLFYNDIYKQEPNITTKQFLLNSNYDLVDKDEERILKNKIERYITSTPEIQHTLRQSWTKQGIMSPSLFKSLGLSK